MEGTLIWSDSVLAKDVLGFREKAEALAELLSSPRTQTPLSVGVFSPSGGGKTTFLQLLAEALKGKEGMEVAWFNVTYQATSGDVALGLAQAVVSSLRQLLPEAEEELSSLSSICQALARRAREERSAWGGPEWRELREGLEGVLSAHLRGRRLCMLLDDVHMVSAEGLSQLLTAMTEWLALEGLIFVVAADPEVLLRVLEERERRVAGELPEPAISARARSVLDKLTQLVVSLPSPSREEVLQLWESLAPDLPSELVEPAAAQPAVNLRRLKQLVNLFRFLHQLGERAGRRAEPRLLLKILVLKTFWEEVWRLLSTYFRERPSPLFVLQKLAEGNLSLELQELLERSPFLKRCQQDLHLMALLRMEPRPSEEELEEVCSLIQLATPRGDEQAQILSDLVSGDPFRVELAASVVGRLSPTLRGSVVAELLHRAERAEEMEKGRIARALGALAEGIPPEQSDAVNNFLLSLFSSESPEVASEAVKAAARICAATEPESSARMEELILSLKEERYEAGVRAAVAAGLAELGPKIPPHRAERPLRALLSLSQDTEATVRREAARGLASVRSPSPQLNEKAVDRLLELLLDSEAQVRAEAASSLVRLLPSLQEWRKEVVGAALVDLAQRTSGALQARTLSLLRQALDHLPPHLRSKAESLLTPS